MLGVDELRCGSLREPGRQHHARSPVHGLRCGLVLSGRESAFVYAAPHLRSRSGRDHSTRLQHRRSQLCLVRERLLQHGDQRCDVHRLARLRGGHVRIGEWHDVGKPPMSDLPDRLELDNAEPGAMPVGERLSAGFPAGGRACLPEPSGVRTLRGGFVLPGRLAAWLSVCNR